MSTPYRQENSFTCCHLNRSRCRTKLQFRSTLKLPQRFLDAFVHLIPKTQRRFGFILLKILNPISLIPEKELIDRFRYVKNLT
jgi:hypothetical protein